MKVLGADGCAGERVCGAAGAASGICGGPGGTEPRVLQPHPGAVPAKSHHGHGCIQQRHLHGARPVLRGRHPRPLPRHPHRRHRHSNGDLLVSTPAPAHVCPPAPAPAPPSNTRVVRACTCVRTHKNTHTKSEPSTHTLAHAFVKNQEDSCCSLQADAMAEALLWTVA